MTFWVHHSADEEPWYRARQYDPPAPDVVPGRGYPYFFVEVDGFTFQFASLAEIDFCLACLGQRHLPDTGPETQGRTGPGAYWQNKLPKAVMSWRFRQKAVKFLAHCREEFAKELLDQGVKGPPQR
jgi:hypothetical protein